MPYNELQVEIHKKNDTNEMMYLTTKDFKVKNTSSNKYLDDSTVKKIFPPDPITGDYVLFARLRPKISNEVPGEEIRINAKMSSYILLEKMACIILFHVAHISILQIKLRRRMDGRQNYSSMTEEEKDPESLTLIEMDYYNHDAKRFFIKDSFDFKIETIGVLTNYDICFQASQIIIEKLLHIKDICI